MTSSAVQPLVSAMPEVRPRVLVAEDQPSIWDALRLLLAAEGYEAEFVGSPAEALAALDANHFDLVLMDLNYTRDTTSGKEGLELVTRIHSRETALPVIVMTAWGSIELAVEALQRGASDFVQKPWDNQHLARILRTQITRGLQMRKDQRERDHEVQEAVRIQQRLLPTEMPKLRGFDLAGESQPARIVGGDYYDVLKLSPERVGICIADVAGKGLPAALLMSNVQATLRAITRPDMPPVEVCTRVNQILCENVDAEKFVSLFYCVLDTATGTLTYTNAGHLPPVLLRPVVGRLTLDSSGAVLGTFPTWQFEQGEVTLRSGDRLVLYTDGVSEAENAAGQEFGEHGVLAVMQENAAAGAAEMRARLMNSVSEHCGGRFSDDATIVVVAAE